MQSILAFIGLLITVIGYVAYVSYRLGNLTNRVENAEGDIQELKTERATNTDIKNIQQQLKEIKDDLQRLFDKKN